MDYSKLDLSALRAYARKQGVRVATNMSRKQLIKAIENKSVGNAKSRTTNKETGSSPASRQKKKIEDFLMSMIQDTPAYKAHVGDNKKNAGAPKTLKESSSTPTPRKRPTDSTKSSAVSNVPRPRKRPTDSTNVPRPRKRPTDSSPGPLRVVIKEGTGPDYSYEDTKDLARMTKKADSSSGAKLKDNMSMSKDKMANSIAAARKRGEAYYFDKKAGEKRLAIRKSDMKEGESLRATANRLLGKGKRKK